MKKIINKENKNEEMYKIRVFNKGYIGEEISNNYSHTISYNYWYAMLRRVYSEKQLKLKPTYKQVEVCEEWLNYTNYKQWFDKNYYTIQDQQMELDKDILDKGNKIYCPEKCIFVPHNINILFVKSNKSRGDLPIGVYFKKKNNKYCSQCNATTKEGKKYNAYLGLFNTPEEAFYAYKQFKENYIKEVADEYKDRIPQKLYEAMYRYEVEITD